MIWINTVCKGRTYPIAAGLGLIMETLLLTLVLLNPDRPCFCKQCRSRSVGFWRSQLIWICTVCHTVYEFMSTIWTKLPDWLKISRGHGILINSASQGLKERLCSQRKQIISFIKVVSNVTEGKYFHVTVMPDGGGIVTPKGDWYTFRGSKTQSELFYLLS